MRCERSLRGLGGADGIVGIGERNEEAIALSVDLLAAVLLERVAQEPPMISQNVGVMVAELVQQTRRSFDVRKEKGDGACRQLGRRPRCQDRTPNRPRLAGFSHGDTRAARAVARPR
jgi:hypothetical protein